MKERWLGPREAAAELGVSAKALRVYERERLVQPGRTAGNWRAYGPDQIARVHLIVVLRELGLSLKAIGAMLLGETPSLASVLTAQQEQLEARRRRIGGAIALLTDARLKLAQGRALTLDDLAKLTRETVMHTTDNQAKLDAGIETHIRRHLGEDEMRAVREGVLAQLASNGLTKADINSEVRILMAEARRLMTAGEDPDSEAAKAVV